MMSSTWPVTASLLVPLKKFYRDTVILPSVLLVGVADDLKGQIPLGLIVLKAGVDRAESDIVAELIQRVRDQIGPVVAFKKARIVHRLPKTRSGKILRGTMVNIADGTAWKMPATIDDPAILDEITEALQALGYAS